ncbi:hypothetical protein LINGRAHAP2_LOCUS26097 [Linum grandiflorum]
MYRIRAYIGHSTCKSEQKQLSEEEDNLHCILLFPMWYKEDEFYRSFPLRKLDPLCIGARWLRTETMVAMVQHLMLLIPPDVGVVKMEFCSGYLGFAT